MALLDGLDLDEPGDLDEAFSRIFDATVLCIARCKEVCGYTTFDVVDDQAQEILAEIKAARARLKGAGGWRGTPRLSEEEGRAFIAEVQAANPQREIWSPYPPVQ